MWVHLFIPTTTTTTTAMLPNHIRTSPKCLSNTSSTLSIPGMQRFFFANLPFSRINNSVSPPHRDPNIRSPHFPSRHSSAPLAGKSPTSIHFFWPQYDSTQKSYFQFGNCGNKLAGSPLFSTFISSLTRLNYTESSGSSTESPAITLAQSDTSLTTGRSGFSSLQLHSTKSGRNRC